MTRAQTTMDFDDAYAFLVELEGGLLKIDAGEGVQYGGILEKYYKPYGKLPNSVLEMTAQDHKNYTHAIYWNPLFDIHICEGNDGNKVYGQDAMPLLQGISAPIFFMAFNAGHEDAVRLAQVTGNFVKQDGILGARTYSFLFSISDPLKWWGAYKFLCTSKYLCHPKEKGLLNRLEKIDRFLRGEAK